MTGIVFLFVVLGLLFFVGLYVLIRDEPASTTITDRSEAEQEAQHFGGLGGRKHTRPRREDHSDESDEDDRSTGWGYSHLDDEERRN